MEKLQATGSVRVGGVTLVPIERARVQSALGDGGCWISAVKEVHAVVVSDAKGIRVLAVGSSAVTLDSLVAEVPGLAAVLSEF